MIIWVLAAVLSVAPTPLRSESLTVSPSKLGNVFILGEDIEVPIHVRGADRIEWQSTNFFGELIGNGRVAAQAGHAVLTPRLAHPGWYDVIVKAFDGQRLAATGRTTVAVLTPLDDLSKGARFGVQTHFAQGWDTDIIPLIARAGIRHVRDEQYWSEVEVERGQYQFPPMYTYYAERLAANGLQLLLELTFANQLYDEGDTPYSKAGRAAYAQYGLALLRRYGKQISEVEVWNEFNGSWCSGPCQKDRPLYYAALLRDTYRAIKQARPDVTVVGAATVRIPLPYLRRLFQFGALQHMDALSVHPYGSVPAMVDREIEILQDLIKTHNNGQPKPIWVTETSLQELKPDGRKNVAQYLVQQTAAMLASGVERVYWYLLRDYHSFETMGLLHDGESRLGRYVPTPAYVAEATLIRQIGGATAIGRQPSDPRTRIYRFRDNDIDCIVAWTVGGDPISAQIQAVGPASLVDMMGKQTELVPINGEVTVTLDQNPIYVRGKLGEVTESRDDILLASSADDFSDQQGGMGWSYGLHVALPAAPYPSERLKPLVWGNDDWGYFWKDDGFPALRVSASTAHPSEQNGTPVWAIRRWRNGFAGEVIISGRFRNDSREGDGVGVGIMVDGSRAFSAKIGGQQNPPEATFSLTRPLRKGSVVDFVVTPGPGHDIDFDSTAFSALVTVRDSTAGEN